MSCKNIDLLNKKLNNLIINIYLNKNDNIIVNKSINDNINADVKQ